jgi:hypothetical protein
MEDCGKVPGVQRVRRYHVVDGPPDRRTNLSITEYDDLDAALAYRSGNEVTQVKQEADRLGVRNRYTIACREVFSITFDEASARS